jgi:hypothetical protein
VSATHALQDVLIVVAESHGNLLKLLLREAHRLCRHQLRPASRYGVPIKDYAQPDEYAPGLTAPSCVHYEKSILHFAARLPYARYISLQRGLATWRQCL